YACRQAKEEILSSEKKQSAPVTVLGRGSKLIGGTVKAELTREDVTATIIEGFFPRVDAAARPVLRQKTGLSEIGLPFEPDAAATKHLARFLGRHGEEGGFARPTALLFNGGVFRAAALRERTREVLDSWLVSTGAKPVKVLEGEDLDLA